MVSNIDARLHHLFLPQLEALNMAPSERRCGIVASLDDGRGAGGAWLAGIGSDCLLTVLDLTVEDAVDLSSETPGYFCVGSMSRSSLETMPVPTPSGAASALVAYCQNPGRYPYRLQPGARYASRSLCFTPAFFGRVARDYAGADRDLLQRLSRPRQQDVPPQLGPMLDALQFQAADRPSTNFHLSALMAETLALLFERAEAALAAENAAGSPSAEQLVLRAQETMARHLDQQITIDSLARDLCVSRAYLAALFKQERGCGVAEELRRLRIARACTLLAETKHPVAAVAREVGYARQSSFATAFKREMGCTPARWRRLHGV